MSASSLRLGRKALLLLVFLLLAATVCWGSTAKASTRSAYPMGSCTIAAPLRQATIDVEIANASDFCELVSHALGSEVFHSRLVVFQSVEWIADGARRSCELRFRRTNYRIVVWGAFDACRWFTRPGTGWHLSSTTEHRL